MKINTKGKLLYGLIRSLVVLFYEIKMKNITIWRKRSGCEGEGKRTLNVTLTLKLRQQSSNKRTKEIREVNTVNRVKRLKGLKGLKGLQVT